MNDLSGAKWREAAAHMAGMQMNALEASIPDAPPPYIRYRCYSCSDVEVDRIGSDIDFVLTKRLRTERPSSTLLGDQYAVELPIKRVLTSSDEVAFAQLKTFQFLRAAPSLPLADAVQRVRSDVKIGVLPSLATSNLLIEVAIREQNYSAALAIVEAMHASGTSLEDSLRSCEGKPFPGITFNVPPRPSTYKKLLQEMTGPISVAVSERKVAAGTTQRSATGHSTLLDDEVVLRCLFNRRPVTVVDEEERVQSISLSKSVLGNADLLVTAEQSIIKFSTAASGTSQLTSTTDVYGAILLQSYTSQAVEGNVASQDLQHLQQSYYDGSLGSSFSDLGAPSGGTLPNIGTPKAKQSFGAVFPVSSQTSQALMATILPSAKRLRNFISSSRQLSLTEELLFALLTLLSAVYALDGKVKDSQLAAALLLAEIHSVLAAVEARIVAMPSEAVLDANCVSVLEAVIAHFAANLPQLMVSAPLPAVSLLWEGLHRMALLVSPKASLPGSSGGSQRGPSPSAAKVTYRQLISKEVSAMVCVNLLPEWLESMSKGTSATSAAAHDVDNAITADEWHVSQNIIAASCVDLLNTLPTPAAIASLGVNFTNEVLQGLATNIIKAMTGLVESAQTDAHQETRPVRLTTEVLTWLDTQISYLAASAAAKKEANQTQLTNSSNTKVEKHTSPALLSYFVTPSSLCSLLSCGKCAIEDALLSVDVVLSALHCFYAGGGQPSQSSLRLILASICRTLAISSSSQLASINQQLVSEVKTKVIAKLKNTNDLLVRNILVTSSGANQQQQPTLSPSALLASRDADAVIRYSQLPVDVTPTSTAEDIVIQFLTPRPTGSLSSDLMVSSSANGPQASSFYVMVIDHSGLDALSITNKALPPDALTMSTEVNAFSSLMAKYTSATGVLLCVSPMALATCSSLSLKMLSQWWAKRVPWLAIAPLQLVGVPIVSTELGKGLQVLQEAASFPSATTDDETANLYAIDYAYTCALATIVKKGGCVKTALATGEPTTQGSLLKACVTDDAVRPACINVADLLSKLVVRK